MLNKNKSYRVFSFRGKVYSGSDSNKQRKVEYLFDGLDRNLFSSFKVLDLGCASAGTLFHLIDKGVLKGVGVERDKRKLDFAQSIVQSEKIENVSLLNIEINQFLRLNREQFDLVLLLNILHHLPNPIEIINRICELAQDFILIETPRKAWYEPYEIDKQARKSFLVPPRKRTLIQAFIDNDFEIVWKSLSPKYVNFQRGRREVILLKKISRKRIDFEAIEEIKPAVILGSGASGKTTLIQDVLGLQKEASLSSHKIREVAQLDQKDNNTFSEKKLFYVSPAIKTPRFNLRFNSFEYNYKAIVRVAKSTNYKVIVCYITKSQLNLRLENRLNDRYLSCFEASVRLQIFEILRQKKSSIFVQLELIRIMGLLNFITHRRVLRMQYFGNINFSYKKLFDYLSKNNIDFYLYQTDK
jgi:SAM-dependent methyltransferase